MGAFLGALAGSAGEALAHLTTRALAVGSAFAFTLVLSGALHLDGFLDGCDAFFACVPPERRLEILDDPRHGTFALTGLAIVVALWLAALWSVPPARYPLALALAAASARGSSVIHALYAPYARPLRTRAFEGRPSTIVLSLGLLLSAALAIPFGSRGAIALVATAGLAALCVSWIRTRLGGGLAGDAYGFTIVVSELCALVVLSW